MFGERWSLATALARAASLADAASGTEASSAAASSVRILIDDSMEIPCERANVSNCRRCIRLQLGTTDAGTGSLAGGMDILQRNSCSIRRLIGAAGRLPP